MCLLSQGCNQEEGTKQKNRTEEVFETASAYFETFAEREDWDRLLSFYRKDIVFDDVMLHLHLDSLWQLKRFYNWDEEGNHFQKLSSDQEHITIESLVANDSVAVARGRINPFYYYGEKIDSEWGMEMCIWLYFDENLKIRKQIDWMEYDPKVWESVLKRYYEHGVEQTPDWLDLSR